MKSEGAHALVHYSDVRIVVQSGGSQGPGVQASPVQVRAMVTAAITVAARVCLL